MSNHKKIDRLRWHKRKEHIKINCAILVAILLIVLLGIMGLPIVSDADEICLNDKYFIGGFLNASGLKQYWADNNIVRPDAYADSIFFDGQEMDYYDAVKDMMLNVKASDFQGSNVDITNRTYTMNICSYPNDNTKLTLVSGRIDWGFEGDGSTSKYTQSDVFLYDISNNTLSNITYSIPTAGVYINLSSVVDKIITSCGTINAGGYYNGYNENYPYIDFNYLYLQNINGAGAGGFSVPEPVDPNQAVLDGDFIYNNSNIFVSGSSASDYKLTVVLDFPEGANPTDYTFSIDLAGDVSVRFIHDSQQNNNFAPYYGVQTFGTIQSGDTMDKDDFTFSGVYSGTLNEGVFTINSTVLNSLMKDSYNAYDIVGGTSDYVVNPQPFFDRVSQLKIYNYYSIPNVLKHSVMDSLGIKSSMPYYTNDNTFSCQTALFTYSLNLYKAGRPIFSVPLSCEYNVLTGASTVTSNPGYDKDDVNRIIDENNQDLQPSDPNYKLPQDYNPTAPIVPNVPSDQTNNNDYSQTHNNTTISDVGDYSPSNIYSPNIVVNPSSNNNQLPDSGLINKIIKVVYDGRNDGVNYIDNRVGASRYIQLMENALIVVPQQVWDLWIDALRAILCIVVGAFFLKVLINWST